jgi:hypothetical protein
MSDAVRLTVGPPSVPDIEPTLIAVGTASIGNGRFSQILFGLGSGVALWDGPWLQSPGGHAAADRPGTT